MNARHLLNRVYVFLANGGGVLSDALAEFDAGLAGEISDRVKQQRLAGVLAAGGEVG